MTCDFGRQRFRSESAEHQRLPMYMPTVRKSAFYAALVLSNSIFARAQGARPTITSAPNVTTYGTSSSVSTPNASSIASVALMRPGATTHAFDEDQRFLTLSFQQAAGGITVQSPANSNLAPPGYYMLFLINQSGGSLGCIVHQGAMIRLWDWPEL
jgi:hypothetical protein